MASCQSVVIRDAEWCGDMGEYGASCFTTLTNQARDIEKTEWDTERFGQICTQPKTFADVKASLEKLCAISHRCSYETATKISEFFKKVDVVSKKASAHAQNK